MRFEAHGSTNGAADSFTNRNTAFLSHILIATDYVKNVVSGVIIIICKTFASEHERNKKLNVRSDNYVERRGPDNI